jgi:alcohol oxidase
VEYKDNPIFHQTDKPASVRTVYARRLVVVSAGAFGSPAILERSGIGRRDVLEKAGVDPLVILNGVGENFQGKFSFSILPRRNRSTYNVDHQLIIAQYSASDESVTMDDLLRGDEEVMKGRIQLQNAIPKRLTV